MMLRWLEKFSEPIVVVAVATGFFAGIGALFGAVTEAVQRNDAQEFEQLANRCRAAFAYLEDDAPNPDLPPALRREFAASQLKVARECGR